MTLLFKRRAIRRLMWLSWVFRSERKESREKGVDGYGDEEDRLGSGAQHYGLFSGGRGSGFVWWLEGG
ncbi:hypothetical protein HAX54_024122, partial [Datura stramonium]|nr:hypothetical protein [Datura stramonium]